MKSRGIFQMKRRTEIFASKNSTSWTHLSAQQQLKGQVNFIPHCIQQHKELKLYLATEPYRWGNWGSGPRGDLLRKTGTEPRLRHSFCKARSSFNSNYKLKGIMIYSKRPNFRILIKYSFNQELLLYPHTKRSANCKTRLKE